MFYVGSGNAQRKVAKENKEECNLTSMNNYQSFKIFASYIKKCFFFFYVSKLYHKSFM